MVLDVEALAPFGEGNPEPVFLARGLDVMGTKVIAERHLKLTVKQDGGVFEAIGFGQAQRKPALGRRVDMVFTPETDHWQGNRQDSTAGGGHGRDGRRKRSSAKESPCVNTFNP